MAKEKEKPKDEEDKPDKGAKKKDETGEEDEATEAGAEKGLKSLFKGKKLIIVIAVLVLLLAGGGGAAFYFLKKHKSDAPEAAPAAEASHETPKEADKPEHSAKEGEKGKEGEAKAPIPGAPVYYNLPEILVNLNTSGNKQTTLLKVAVTLELASPQDTQMIDANLPRIQDSFNTYLREMRASDLAGSAGIYRLREELLLRINKIISPAKVNDILFKNILVQ